MIDSPVTFYKRPKPFDGNAAVSDYLTAHADFVARTKSEPVMTVPSVHVSSPKHFFQTQFSRVLLERMLGLPIVNNSLEVFATEFEMMPVNDVTEAKNSIAMNVWLGVVQTPWSVQIVLAASDEASRWNFRAGVKRDIELPGGVFTFVATEDSLLGACLMSSLKSPVFEFSDQPTAQAFALACQQLVAGKIALTDPPEETETLKTDETSSKEPTNVTRRDILGGLFRRCPESGVEIRHPKNKKE